MPITVSFGDDVLYSTLLDWLSRVDDKNYVYIWPFREVTFFREEDAMAFMFTFDSKRQTTKIEAMIKYTLDDD